MSRVNGPLCVLAAIACVGVAQGGTTGSEQRGAALVLSAHHFMFDRYDTSNARQMAINLTQPSREIVKSGLTMLAGATTFAALSASGSITVPCARGGTLSAQLTGDPQKTLHLQWNACVLLRGTLDATHHGVADVALISESFASAEISSLRLGDAMQDFTVSTLQTFSSGDVTTDVRSFNLRMTGNIPMTQTNATGPFLGAFAYELTGFWEMLIRIVPPTPAQGLPSEHRRRISAE